MQPTIDILGLSLKTFGLMFALAFLLAGAMIARRLRELGRPLDWAYEMLFAALFGSLIGARLDFLVENYSAVRGDLSGSLFSGAGLVWYGGLLGGALAVMVWARRRAIATVALADLSAPVLCAGYALGRIGCQLSGDGDYGIRSTLPWAMGYPHGTLPTAPGVTVQPTPIYETLAMGLLAWWLWRNRERLAPGLAGAYYLLFSGTERLLIEFVRRNPEVFAGLTTAQLESIALMSIGVVWVIRLSTSSTGGSPLR